MSGAEPAPRPETERSPATFFVLVEDGGHAALHGTLYAVLMPRDAGRFRVWDDGDGFDVLFKLRGRWRRVDAARRQLKGRDLDPAENRPVAVTTFGRKVLKEYGVREWKPKKLSTSGILEKSGR